MDNFEYVEKDKRRGERRHRDIKVRERRLKELKGVDRNYYEDIVKKSRQGHYRDHSPLDCGHAGCMLCHSNKLNQDRPVKELLTEEEEDWSEDERDY